ncbi:unnamed protein product [Parajaminaea phylloscopi]
MTNTSDADAKKRFSAQDIPDLTGLTALVTGGNAGIGLETVKQLALHGARVFIASRSEDKGKKAIAQLRKDHPDKDLALDFLRLDLADLQSVVDGAQELRAQRQVKALDILVCNAGTMACPYQLTKDGIEIQFQTNYLGHFLLVRQLTDILEAGFKQRPGNHPSRVVLLSSLAHTIIYRTPFAHPDYSSLEKVNRTFGPSFTPMATWLRYSQAKLAAIHQARQINARLSSRGIQAVAVHPGLIDSDLWKYVPGRSILAKRVLQPVSVGALSPLRAATSPEIERDGTWDQYLAEYGEPAAQTPQSKDDQLAEQLYQLSEKLVAEKTTAPAAAAPAAAADAAPTAAKPAAEAQ